MKQETPMAVCIVSRMQCGDETDTVTTTARGTLRQVGGHLSLAYTEIRDQGQKVMTTLSWQPGSPRLHLKSRGGVKWEVIFDPENPADTCYEIPPHAFDITVRCHELQLPLDETGGEIHLIYTRLMGGDETRVELTLTAEIREVDG